MLEQICSYRSRKTSGHSLKRSNVYLENVSLGVENFNLAVEGLPTGGNMIFHKQFHSREWVASGTVS